MIKVVLNRNSIEKAITRRNLSRKGFAYELGISRCYLSRIISGKVEPSAAMRQRLLDYLRDCTFDDLFTIEEDGHGGNGKR
jgi:transcriptional regulator with XRE-family HTH domain